MQPSLIKRIVVTAEQARALLDGSLSEWREPIPNLPDGAQNVRIVGDVLKFGTYSGTDPFGRRPLQWGDVVSQYVHGDPLLLWLAEPWAPADRWLLGHACSPPRYVWFQSDDTIHHPDGVLPAGHRGRYSLPPSPPRWYSGRQLARSCCRRTRLVVDGLWVDGGGDVPWQFVFHIVNRSVAP